MSREYGGRVADTKTSRHSWLRITSGLVGLILTLPVLAWSVAAILPSHNALTFISSVLVGSLAVPALVIAVIAFVLALLGRGGLRVVAVVFSVMALIVPVAATATTAWITDRAGGRINVVSAAAVSSMSDHPDETVRYGSGPDETAQIYRAHNHNAPVLVDIHGGGWSTDATMPATLRWFSDHGWLVIRPSYTLATQGHPTWNTAPKQVACAWAWSLSHVKELGGDPSQVSIMGDSAGGGMAINLAYGAASGKLKSSCGSIRAPKSVLALYPTVDVGTVESVTTLSAGNAAKMYIGGTPKQFPDRYRCQQFHLDHSSGTTNNGDPGKSRHLCSAIQCAEIRQSCPPGWSPGRSRTVTDAQSRFRFPGAQLTGIPGRHEPWATFPY